MLIKTCLRSFNNFFKKLSFDYVIEKKLHYICFEGKSYETYP